MRGQDARQALMLLGLTANDLVPMDHPLRQMKSVVERALASLSPTFAQTHASRTDPETRLARKGKGKEAKLCLMGHALMENRHGLVVDVLITQATRTAEREAALTILDRRPSQSQRVTLGGDKGYDTRAFVASCRQRHVTPHVAQNTRGRRSAIDELYPPLGVRHQSTSSQAGGGDLRQDEDGGRRTEAALPGIARNQLWAERTITAYNLVRIANLAATA
jgi:hypothetical protein